MTDKLTYCFDLDGTLCTNTFGEYEKAVPFKDRINKVNKLYNQGHKIVIDTARGSTTGKNWFDLTEKQLEKWGLKYHMLRVGRKIQADIYIDDKAINSDIYFKND